MIIKSNARRTGNLASHLLDNKKNERVVERRDLDRDADTYLCAALLDFAATAKLFNSSLRARQLFHVKISPNHILTEEEFLRTIELIEAEHKIPSSTPRKVIEHLKGNRAPHYHIVYSHYDPISGKAICTKRNHFNDEMASRLCEIEFNEPIIIGPHTELNAQELERRDCPEEGARLRNAIILKEERSENRSAIHYNDGERLKKSLILENKIGELFVQNDRDIGKFKTAAIAAGFVFAMGDKAILITHPETRISIPLLRLLKKQIKTRGLNADLRKADLGYLTNAEPVLPVKKVLEEYTTRKINHVKRRAMAERDLFLRYMPHAKVLSPADPEVGKKGKPTIASIATAIEKNLNLQEMLRQKLLTILLKKKIIRRLSKRLQRMSPRGITRLVDTLPGSMMDANRIAMMRNARVRNKKHVPQIPIDTPVQRSIKSGTHSRKSATLQKVKQKNTGIER